MILTDLFFLSIIYLDEFQRSGLFKITKAAITPGTQPQRVRINTIKTEPHPWSITASGGNKIDSNTRKKLIYNTITAKI
jgi:hypothetical protein